jgi:hypothetical protein
MTSEAGPVARWRPTPLLVTAATLHRLGYRFAQGYRFSRPLTPEQVGEHLAAVTPATV